MRARFRFAHSFLSDELGSTAGGIGILRRRLSAD
jgi:hypothetical protein